MGNKQKFDQVFGTENPKTSNILYLIFELWGHVDGMRRLQFLALLFLMLFASFAEILSLGAVIPFLAILTAPEKIFIHPAAQSFIDYLGLVEPSQLLLPLTTLFAVAVLFAAFTRLLMLWVSVRFAFAIGADLSIKIYQRTLYQPYNVHCSRNSSDVIAGISSKTGTVIYGVVVPIITLISSLIIMASILMLFCFLQPTLTLLIFFGFGFIYGAIVFFCRKQVAKDSKRIAMESSNVIKALQEGLGGIRDVLLDGSQSVYCNIYRASDLPLRRSQGNNLFIAQAPRFLMEGLGMFLIALVAFYFSKSVTEFSTIVPLLGALALGAQRLLPMLQSSYASWTVINGSRASLCDTLRLLNQPLPDYANINIRKPLAFISDIKLKSLGYRYSEDTPFIFKNLNISIPRGARVGFIGTTGSGKSTLLDIVMGLLQPSEGSIEVDGEPINNKNLRAWQLNIAHVPQTIFLADSTIEENIAFGIPKEKINHERVEMAANQAQLSELIDSWPNRYRTLVGERGILLSGGQRQRIGIARALYKNANVIIFDEATSALDNATEENVMNAIESLDKDITLLIIAHRLSTVDNCDQIINLNEMVSK